LRGKIQTIDIVTGLIEMTESSNKDTSIDIIAVFHMFKNLQHRYRRYEKDPNRHSGSEN
jgi:hypothetical protein